MTISTDILNSVEAVCFDAFGTLVEITNRKNPFKHLIRQFDEEQRRSFMHRIMREDVQPQDWPQLLMADVEQNAIEDMLSDLNTELASVALRSGALELIREIKAAGLKFAICSNLATSYGPSLKEAIPIDPDIWLLSYEIGSIKPETEIYDAMERRINISADRILFTGDSRLNDIEAPRRHGFKSVHIDELISTVHPPR